MAIFAGMPELHFLAQLIPPGIPRLHHLVLTLNRDVYLEFTLDRDVYLRFTLDRDVCLGFTLNRGVSATYLSGKTLAVAPPEAPSSPHLFCLSDTSYKRRISAAKISCFLRHARVTFVSSRSLFHQASCACITQGFGFRVWWFGLGLRVECQGLSLQCLVLTV